MNRGKISISDYFFIIFSQIFLVYFIIMSIIYLTFVPFIVLISLIAEGCGIDGSARRFTYIYSKFSMALFWPVLRISVAGRELQPGGPVVYVVNHRSAVDAYLTAAYAHCHTIMFVRAWPFKIPFYGTIMRLNGYVNSEEMSFFEFVETKGKELVSRNVSMLIFPEGHRSPDNKLHRFHSGAFSLSCSLNIPVVPVCITGSERCLSKQRPYLFPAKIHIEILPPVFNDAFTGQFREYEMKKHVFNLMKNKLGE
ncbi:MAG: 1-acyl-sn-glycerol-3-phosphate acyltransferase [Nitrospirae bacterium YQR-1]